jgi:hypothetical protein
MICARCRGELRDLPVVNAERLARLIVESYIGLGVIREAVDAAFAASARTNTMPTRRSLRAIAAAWLDMRVNREIDRRIHLLQREDARRVA